MPVCAAKKSTARNAKIFSGLETTKGSWSRLKAGPPSEFPRSATDG